MERLFNAPEIVILVFQSCDKVGDGLSLASACRSLASIWRTHAAAILCPLLEAQTAGFSQALLAVSLTIPVETARLWLLGWGRCECDENKDKVRYKLVEFHVPCPGISGIPSRVFLALGACLNHLAIQVCSSAPSTHLWSGCSRSHSPAVFFRACSS